MIIAKKKGNILFLAVGKTVVKQLDKKKPRHLKKKIKGRIAR